MKFKNIILAGGALILATSMLNSCKTGIPKGATAVTNFDADKYLGKWHEIARFDYIFERGLENCTAEYSKNPDGSIKVVNRGYSAKNNKWKQSEGEARFIESPNVARLKVSFFKPIWTGYNVISIDEDYKYALVASDNLKYLWILSRETSIPNDIKDKYLKMAKDLGYQKDKLIWPKTN